MKNKPYNPALDPEMLSLFQKEVATHINTLTSGLIDIENPSNTTGEVSIDALLRAAHSIKGAAKMVGVDSVVKISHALEDCFIAVQKGLLDISANDVDTFLSCADLINSISIDNKNQDQEKLTDELSKKLHAIKTHSYTITEDNHPEPQKSINDNTTAAASMFRSDSMRTFLEIQSHIDACQVTGYSSQQASQLSHAIHKIGHAADLALQKLISTLCASMSNYIDTHSRVNKRFEPEAIENLISPLSTLYLYLSNPEFVLNEEKQTINKQISILDGMSNTLLTSGKNQHAGNTGKKASRKKQRKSSTNKILQKDDHTIKVSSQRLNILVGLASETLVESKWVRNHANNLYQLKKNQSELYEDIEKFRVLLQENNISNEIIDSLGKIQSRRLRTQDFLTRNIGEVEDYDRRLGRLATRLNNEIQKTRMRPFSDITHNLPRMVRDLSRSIGKNIRLNITGGNTQVDREILDRIESPINHIVRNAIDHGIEFPATRQSCGKSDKAVIHIEASHAMGMLSITIQDDGQGINYDTLREKIVTRNVASFDVAKNLTEAELLEFLYLPGFSTRDEVTDISGRGVGLDVVYTTINSIRGKIRTSSEYGKYLKIQILVPLTLSIVKCLIAEINAQPFAFPLSRIDSIHHLSCDEIGVLEGKQYFSHNELNIGLVDAGQVLEIEGKKHPQTNLSVIVLSDLSNRYGLVVDKFCGEKELSVQAIDSHLGKIRDVSAAALLETGEPVMIIDVDDMLRSISMLVSGEYLQRVNQSAPETTPIQPTKRILVIDDSITIREVEKKLLTIKGYLVDIAIDGMDAWNSVRSNNYDLIISDIDMPRMNGIEFIEKMKSSQTLSHIPIMIISYKDRDEDRNAGLQAGADYYLTKASFDDDSLVDAVVDLIGEAEQTG